MGSIIVGIIILVWLVFAIRYTIKHGGGDCSSGCGGCSSKDTCSSTSIDTKKSPSLYESYRKDHKKPI